MTTKRAMSKRQERILKVMRDLRMRRTELEAEQRRIESTVERYSVKGRDEGLSVRQLADASGRSKSWIGSTWTKAQQAFDERMGM